MIYGSVCSGIEAASVAWHPLGWTPAFFSEIEPFARAVLAHHWPHVPLHGDFTTIQQGDYAVIDVLVGGTPCQSFSVAGLRGGMDDARGNLALEFLRLAARLRPQWVVWENVPGVLSSGAGRDFGAFLGGLAELGYGWAYRVLDAQYVRVDGHARAVPQRRRRVFVVGHLGDWRRAAAVLFEPESLSGHPPPRREAGQSAPTLPCRSTAGGGMGTDFDCDGGLIAPEIVPQAMSSKWAKGSSGPAGDEVCNLIAHTVGFDATAFNWMNGGGYGEAHDGLAVSEEHCPPLSRSQTPAVAFTCKDHGADAGDIAPTLRAMPHDGSHANGGGQVAVAFSENQRAEVLESDVTRSLASGGGKPGTGYQAVRTAMAVRRLTPTECERLQGFPDDYTLIPGYDRRRTGIYGGNRGAADGPRYRALGNSMAVNVMRWIGARIALLEELLH